MPDRQLFLVSANKSRKSGQPWSDDDYDVRDGAPDGPVIGRIYLAPHRPGDQWFWTLTAFPSSGADSGYAETRQAAMAAVKARWIDR